MNVALGLAFSPLTEVRKVRIAGVADWDRGRIVQCIQSLKGLPGLRVAPRAFETRVLAQRAVRSADLRRSIFGSATLHLEYRTPVARIEETRNAYLSRDGVVFAQPPVAAPASLVLPALRLHPSLLRPHFTLVGGWPAKRIAELVEQLPASMRQKLTVEVDSEGAICLNTKEGARIFLGGTDRLAEKLQTLRTLLSDNGELLGHVTELNLIEPTRPAWKSRVEQKR